MPRMVQKQKGLFGETIYTDENFRVIGYSHKGLFGDEIFLDRNMRYAGEKRKGLFGEDVYVDRNWHVTGYSRQGLGHEKIILDRNSRYKGRTGSLGREEYLIMDGDPDAENAEEFRPSSGIIGGIIFFAFLLIAAVWLALTVLK